MYRAVVAPALGLLTLIASACAVKGAEPPVTAGNGVSVNNGVVTLDESKVPVLPTNCAEGQLVAKTKTGWECVTPAQPELLKAGDGINVESNTISARFGTGHTDVATGDHNHDGVYRKESEKVAWSDVDAMPTDVWPGSVPYSQITGAPALDWNMVGPTVKQDTPWPGQVDYSHLTNVPAPYTDMQAQAAVRWNTVKSSVQATDTWPGQVSYSQVAGAPTVNWSTVGATVPAGGVSNAMLANASISVSTQAPLTGGGMVSLGGSVSLGLDTVSVANGGTGQTSWPAGSVVVANGAGTALGGIAPGASGNVLTSTGSAWQSQPMVAAGIARVTTSNLTLYVRADGDDNACDGSADASGASAPSCALASLQRAIDLVPDTIRHAVTINVGAGTYYAPSGASSLVAISKGGRPNAGSIVINGNGSVILSGASAADPGTSLTDTGVDLESSSIPLTIRNVILTHFNGITVAVSRSRITLDGITIQSSGTGGLLCTAGAYCAVTGTTSITGASSYGAYAHFGADLQVTGGSFSTTGNLDGVVVDNGAQFLSLAPFTSSNNSGRGLRIWYGGLAQLQANATLSNNGRDAIDVEGSAGLVVSGGLTISGNSGNGILADTAADVHLVASAPIFIACNGSNYGISQMNGSNVTVVGTSSVSISNCSIGIRTWYRSGFIDYGTGSRSITNASPLANVDFESTYTRGNFPAAVCGAYAYCQ